MMREVRKTRTYLWRLGDIINNNSSIRIPKIYRS
jgi:hypothetical protein